MLLFNAEFLREEFDLVDRKLNKIVNATATIKEVLFEKNTVVTSVYRDDPDSTHYYYRAVDLRSRDLTEKQCKKLEKIINQLFPYGKKPYQTMLYHNSGSGWHFHIQVRAEHDEEV